MKTRRHSTCQGVVLVAVLIICLGLVSIILLFAHTSLMNYRASQNEVAGHQAEQAVEGGARYAKHLIETAFASKPGAMPDPANFIAEDLPLGASSFWFIGRSLQQTTTTLRDPYFGLVDEAGKLNLNNPAVTADVLLKLPGMTQTFAAAIEDWRRTGTAKSSDTYGQRQPPYHRKAAPYDSLEELALVDGADLSVLGARDMNLNGVRDVEENDSKTSLTSSVSSTVDGPGVKEYLTVFSREANPPGGPGGPRTQVTNADSVRTYLNTKFPGGRGQTIFQNLSPAGTITGPLHFFIASQMDTTEFESCLADLRFFPEDPIYPVNVNTASADVLKAIPGLESYADKIITARAALAAGTTGFGWLKDVLQNDVAAAKAAAPLVTGQTSVISADVAAVGRYGRGYRRTQFVFESGATAKVIYRRNLGALGWALGREVRTTLAANKERR